MTATPIADTGAFVVTLVNLDRQAFQVVVSGDIEVVEQRDSPVTYRYRWEEGDNLGEE